MGGGAELTVGDELTLETLDTGEADICNFICLKFWNLVQIDLDWVRGSGKFSDKDEKKVRNAFFQLYKMKKQEQIAGKQIFQSSSQMSILL